MESQPMKASELGRFVCVAQGAGEARGCLHRDRTISADGVWVRSSDPQVPGSHMYSSAHRDCFEAWQQREEGPAGPTKRGIVHVSSRHPQTGGVDGGPYVSGRELERVERAQRQWMAQGYGVAPVPEDGQEHPEDRPCPACST